MMIPRMQMARERVKAVMAPVFEAFVCGRQAFAFIHTLSRFCQ
jgi:hypothetical protein